MFGPISIFGMLQEKSKQIFKEIRVGTFFASEQ